MADPADCGTEWLQDNPYMAIEDTQTIACHRVHNRASPILSQTSDNADVSLTNTQSSFCARGEISKVSDGSFIPEDMVLA